MASEDVICAAFALLNSFVLITYKAFSDDVRLRPQVSADEINNLNRFFPQVVKAINPKYELLLK